MDPNAVARAFVEHYYSQFDSNRAALGNLYHDSSMLTFEGQKFQGAAAITGKLSSLPFQQCKHGISTIDCQPSGAGGGMLVFVSGSLQLAGEEHQLKFSQLFHLIPTPQGSFYVFNDIFRLNYSAKRMAHLGTTRFHANEISSTADVIPSSEVLARIEVLVKRFLTSLMEPTPSVYDLSLVSRTSSNAMLQEGLTEADSIFLSQAQQKLSFLSSHSVKNYFRVWKVLELCYQLLGVGRKVTQREMFYKLLSDAPEFFSKQSQVNYTIQEVVALLKCSRYSLGILASAKGTIVGRVILEEPNREVVDCTNVGIGGHLITADLGMIQNLIAKSDARYILVIEKDAIFQRLSEDRFFQSLPSILITAKGYPDLATRVMLHKLNRSFPHVPIVALVDWNPSGLGILCTYKFGSVNMGLEASAYVCDVKWLGLRDEDLSLIPDEAFGDLSKKDLQVAKGILSSKMLQNYACYKEELQRMLETGKRVDIEALYVHGYDFLAKFVARKIVQMQYI